ncbi:uncharacterized protein LACBIDRAFT_334450 [Laccaria bicolor S238N-H82]|uniref:Predicted protein n=1 Tax=Laccaria bicolor (strain S238N-H82 / ATCC MYA-4686) TaxID=486041 RepID=B0DZ90_LACBS|nr:uncharacterized protein LACBIDRAFT_334450 [Laccaria bicolor S238N-H82]EDR00076.1 predicted protein [Laccaria bicolor S238N-H82]|eukprot:XP_001889282.1 predicted protein [Laccaria bicolor S238N-H82]
MRISSKRSGTQHHGCGNARQERSRSANVGVVAYEGDDVLNFDTLQVFSTLPPTIDQCPGPAYQKFRFKIYSLLGSTSEASIYNLNPVQDEDFVRGYKSLIAGTAPCLVHTNSQAASMMVNTSQRPTRCQSLTYPAK